MKPRFHRPSAHRTTKWLNEAEIAAMAQARDWLKAVGTSVGSFTSHLEPTDYPTTEHVIRISTEHPISAREAEMMHRAFTGSPVAHSLLINRLIGNPE